MDYTTLIDPQTLAQYLDHPDWALVDCRFSLDEPRQGEESYLEAHIPGAVYADLNKDLAGPVLPGKTGRHPLPSVERLSRTLSNWGIDAGVQVVAYDDLGGAYAARLWWMLRWLGHDRVAVLDGGWTVWKQQSRPVRSGLESREPRDFTPKPREGLWVTSEEVEALLLKSDSRILDARSADRFRGKNENRDPIAGHVPRAVSAPYLENLDEKSRFQPAEELRSRYKALLNGVPAQNSVVYCGSGVTAAHDVLAMVHAGLGEARLYAGSWSEWITDPDHPIAK
jgi:thiosulfate/3-mercaptopyruvate sulfurtransferase